MSDLGRSSPSAPLPRACYFTFQFYNLAPFRRPTTVETSTLVFESG